MERVTVIGSTGPAGAMLVEYLRDRAFWVRAADAPDRVGHPRANERVAVDLTDRAQATNAVIGVGHVFLLDLALPRIRPSPRPPGALSAELAMLANVITAAFAAKVTRLLYAAPAHDQPPWADLPALTTPLLSDAEAGGLEVRHALLPNVYGSSQPGRTAATPVDELVRAAAGTPQPGAGVTDVDADRVPLCYAPDCAVALYLLMRSNHRQPLLLAHPRWQSLGDVATELSRLTLRPVVTAQASEPVAFRPPASTPADLRRALAWTPPTDLRVSLLRLLNGFVDTTGNRP
jgi:nucleoside-diphosphate-sugar epimerase